MKKIIALFTALISFVACTSSNDILVEAESFSTKGGWSVDQQFTFEMGSPYLIAHGMGNAVEDATTTVSLPRTGEWHIYARTYNWTSPWAEGRGAGGFRIGLGDELLPNYLGVEGNAWEWQYAGSVNIEKRG